uniref:BIG2 domain-containing protein n=1 Tax=mine drainage metagenome TaxID=410659 RepID=E6Q2I8_9ZZZZ
MTRSFFRLSGLVGMLILAVACSPASNGSGVVSGGSTTTPPLSVNLIGPLQYIGQTAVLQVSEPGFLGPYTITSSDGSVLALAQKLTSTQRGPAGTGAPQTIISPNGQAYVTAVGQGSASLTVNGAGSLSVSPSSLQNLSIGGALPGSLVAAPNAFAFTALAQTASFTLTETGYSGPWSATSSNPSAVTVSPSSGNGPFTVTAVAAGSATISVTDGQNNTISVPAGVTTTSGSIQ